MRHKFTPRGRIPALALVSATVFIALLSGPASSPAQGTIAFPQGGTLSNGIAWQAGPVGPVVDGRAPYHVYLRGQPRIKRSYGEYAAKHYNVLVGSGSQFEREAGSLFRRSTRFYAGSGDTILVQPCRRVTKYLHTMSICNGWASFRIR